MTEGRTWLPAYYLDEVVPPGKADPSDWIDRETEPRYFAMHNGFESEAGKQKIVAAGELVEFYCCDDYGSVLVTIERSGAFQAQGPIPTEATHFWDGDPDTLGSSMQEFADNWAAMMDSDESSATVEVRMAAWSDGPVMFRLVVEADGPKFKIEGKAS